jgi:hypothetical protein
MAMYCPALAQNKDVKVCPDMKISFTVKGISENKNNGEIKLTIEGGRAPYVIQWLSYDFHEKGQHIQNLKTGYYSAIIVDADKCTGKIENIQVENIGKLN